MNPVDSCALGKDDVIMKVRQYLPLIFVAGGIVGFGLASASGSGPVLSISGGNPLILSWPTNPPSFGLVTKTNLGPGGPWRPWPVKPVVIGTNCVVTNTPTDPVRLFRLSNIQCMNQMKQIGIAFRVWQIYNYDLFPFELSTNLGGTKELRAIGPGGFDTNTYIHFQVISNELTTPSLLVCPGDFFRNSAENFQTLGPENVTYRLRTTNSVTSVNPDEILAVCPVDGTTLRCDGSVTGGTNF